MSPPLTAWTLTIDIIWTLFRAALFSRPNVLPGLFRREGNEEAVDAGLRKGDEKAEASGAGMVPEKGAEGEAALGAVKCREVQAAPSTRLENTREGTVPAGHGQRVAQPAII